MSLRDHEPTVIEDFNGLWKRGDQESCPLDHFSDCNNIQFFESGFETRDGIDTFIAKGNVLRIYTYVMQNGESLLILTTDGEIFHALLDGSETIYGPILSIPEMTDFGFVGYNGRAYITPFKTYTKDTNEEYQKGLEGEFVYVYKGDGTDARKAAGDPPTYNDDTINAGLVVYEFSIEGSITLGIHVVGVTYSDGLGGDSTAIGPSVLPILYASGDKQAITGNLPISADPSLTQRKIWMTHAIDAAVFDPDDVGSYTFYLAKTVDNMTDISTVIDISDANLTTAFVAGALANPTSGGMTVENSSEAGNTDIGLHIIGVVYETDTGYLTAIGPEVFAVNSFVGTRKVTVDDIPVPSDVFIVSKHLVSTKRITAYNGDDHGYQFFFIPSATLDPSDTTWTGEYYDAELLEDASYLVDNFSEIPAGVRLTTYNGRLVLTTTFDDISLLWVSAPGEPEAIDQVDGVIIVPLDGDPITSAQEFRDILYAFKKTKTFSITDNGEEPSAWPVIPIDQGIGCSVHGVAAVLDSGGVNIEFLMIVDWSGLMLFDGFYKRPELTWKIADLWLALERNSFANIQIMNDSLSQKIYITLPSKQMLFGNYENGLTAEDVRWCPWTFDIETTTIALIDTNTLLIGSEQEA